MKQYTQTIFLTPLQNTQYFEFIMCNLNKKMYKMKFKNFSRHKPESVPANRMASLCRFCSQKPFSRLTQSQLTPDPELNPAPKSCRFSLLRSRPQEPELVKSSLPVKLHSSLDSVSWIPSPDPLSPSCWALSSGTANFCDSGTGPFSQDQHKPYQSEKEQVTLA